MKIVQAESGTSFEEEVQTGKRFEFGKNWAAFLSTLDDDRIRIAENSLKEMLAVTDLTGKTFLDAGSGSGLFSLSARRLGARVTSFDYDPSSVACATELRSRYFPEDSDWDVKQGSVLDKAFLSSLGEFDVVYSWGVLHHTGSMWEALDNAGSLVKQNGSLFISIYNDQGMVSKLWWKVKKVYCSAFIGKLLVCSLFFPYFFLRTLLLSIVTRENSFASYKKNRGMSIVYDWYDWLGGFPFEVAKPEELFHFYKARGFRLENLVTSNRLGTNQLVFIRDRRQASPTPDSNA